MPHDLASSLGWIGLSDEDQKRAQDVNVHQPDRFFLSAGPACG
jgi:hypothetical protein